MLIPPVRKELHVPSTRTAADRSQPLRVPSQTPKGGFPLPSVAGVKIFIDWSLLLIFALVTFNLGAGMFPRLHPDWGPVLSWATALTAAVLFFASVLAHELAHALVARRRGIPVHSITLFLFGGMAQIEGEAPSPKAEFAMAIVGPIASIAIGVTATWLGVALAGDSFIATLDPQNAGNFEQAFSEAGPLATLLLWLGPVNIFLGVFNMLPGFPLDGGRVLRALLWWGTKDFTKATRWAAGAGQLLSWFLIALGIMNFLAGAIGQGVWLLLLGWFLNNAARASYQDLLVHRALDHVPVARLMRTQIDRVEPKLSLEGLVRDHLMTSDQQGFPVEHEDILLGMVSAEDVRGVPQSAWARTTVEQVMTPASTLSALAPDADAQRVLTDLERKDVDLPVVSNRHLVGLVRRGDVLKWLMLQTPSIQQR